MQKKVIWIAIIGLAILHACLQAGEIQSDTLFHIKTGEWIIVNGKIPHADIFSWTIPNSHWIAHEWLWELLAYLFYYKLGNWGTFLLSSVGVIMYAIFLWEILKRRCSIPVSAVILILALISLSPFWCARPHVIAYGLFALTMYILFTAKESPRRLWLLPIITAIWVNMHGSVIPGIMLIIGFCFFSVVNLGPLSGVNYNKLGILSLLVIASTTLNPNGLKIWEYVFFTISNENFSKYITEWFSPNFQNSSMFLGMFLLLILIVAVSVKKDKSFLFEGILTAATCAMWLYSTRHMPYFVFCGSLLLSSTIGSYRVKKIVLRPISIILAMCLIVLNIASPDWVKKDYYQEIFPVKAVDYMHRENLTKNVFNLYYWGGYLIFKDIPVFVDGRADIYEASEKNVFKDYLDATNLRETKKVKDPMDVLKKWNVNVVLIPPNITLNLILQKEKEWNEVYRDTMAVVYKKVSSGKMESQ